MNVPSLLKSLRENKENRLQIFANSVLDLPYLISPLAAYKQKEILVTKTSGFDCVTLVEHYLSALNSKNLNEYKTNLRKVRYLNSIISWKTRKHYFSTWLKDNQKIGLIQKVSQKNSLNKKCLLNIVPGIPELKISFKYSDSSEFKNGDIITFVSSADNLDYFHVGIIFNSNKKIKNHFQRPMKNQHNSF